MDALLSRVIETGQTTFRGLVDPNKANPDRIYLQTRRSESVLRREV